MGVVVGGVVVGGGVVGTALVGAGLVGGLLVGAVLVGVAVVGAGVGQSLVQPAVPSTRPAVRVAVARIRRMLINSMVGALYRAFSRVGAVVASSETLRLAADIPVARGAWLRVPALHRRVVVYVVVHQDSQPRCWKRTVRPKMARH